MKHLSALAAVLLLCLSGCGEPGLPSAGETNPPAVSLPAQTEAQTDAPGSSLSVTRPDLMIYTEPGYDFADTGILLDPGDYVIAEETVDSEGIRWGKLPSGEGWIDLDKAAEEAHVPLTMEATTERTLGGDEYHECLLSSSDYAQRILFRAQEILTDIRFTAMDFAENGLFPTGELYSLAELTPEKPLVFVAAFPGDLTTYGLFYTDASGVEHHCILCQSGRNGSLVLQERAP